MKRVLVLGASGVMGGRVCGLLRRELPELTVLPASRRGAGGRRADVRDAAGLRGVLGDVDLLVNAVGPYRYDPRPVVGACAEAGCHYLDLAEAPDFVAAAERAARGVAVTVVAGCSTVPGTLEVFAQGLGPEVREVVAWLSIGSGNPVGAGLLYGLLRPLGRRDPDGTRYFGALEARALGDGRRLRFGRYPAALRDGQVGVGGGADRVPARFYTGFDRAWLVAALVAAAPLLRRLGDPTLAALSRAALPAARLLARVGGRRGVLRIEGRSAAGAPVAAVELHADREGLDVPAAPVLWAARRLARGAAGLEGPRRLPELVSAAEAEAWLLGAGYRVVREPG